MVDNLHDPVARGAGPYLSVLFYKDVVDIGFCFDAVVVHRQTGVLMSIVNDDGIVGAQYQIALLVLVDTVDVIVGKSSVTFFRTPDDGEVVSVVKVETIACGNPNESLAVLEHLVGHVARQFIVGIEKFAYLGLYAE